MSLPLDWMIPLRDPQTSKENSDKAVGTAHLSDAAAATSSDTSDTSDTSEAGPDVEILDLTLARHFLAARNGDKEAFSAIYSRFASTVHGILVCRVGVAEAEDLVQEAFLKIYKGLGSVQDVKSMPGWICTLTRNLATDQQRKKARRPKSSEDSSRILSAIEGPETGNGELAQQVWQRIQELPESYRETLTLRLVEGLSGPEIAARTGLKPTSVRVNLCRGMAMLRPLLQKDGWS